MSELLPYKLNKLLIVIFFISLFTAPAFAVSVTTDAATSITTQGAILNMNVSDISTSATVYFEFSENADFYQYRTDTVTRTTNGTYSETLFSYPLIAGHTWYYRAVATESGTTVYGSQVSFALPATTTITEYTFDKNYQDLKDANLNTTELATTIPTEYTDIVGSLFWGFFFGLIFLIYWIREDSVVIPSILGILMSGTILSFLPPLWANAANALFIISIAGIIYSWAKSRK